MRDGEPMNDTYTPALTELGNILATTAAHYTQATNEDTIRHEARLAAIADFAHTATGRMSVDDFKECLPDGTETIPRESTRIYRDQYTKTLNQLAEASRLP